MMGIKSWKWFPAPSHGSSPTLILRPLPIFQEIMFPTRGKELTRSFQTVDPLKDLIGYWNHYAIFRLGRYLEVMTLVHREFP
jgi:hypothetical protein